MRKFVIGLALIASIAVVSAPVADAHTLSYRRANAVAGNAMLQFVKHYEPRLGFGTFSPPLSSRRVSRHKWIFRFAFRFDGDATTEGHCNVTVWYRNGQSQTTSWRVYNIRVE